MIIKENEIFLHDNFNKRWLHFNSPLKIITTNRISEVFNVIAEVEYLVNTKKYWAAGFVSYEAAKAFDKAMETKTDDSFPFAWFGLYNKPVIIENIERPEQTKYELLLHKNISDEEYKNAFEKIKLYIEQGDTYQINFTYRLLANSIYDPWAIFKKLVAHQSPGYSAYVNLKDYTICSASPELFFSLNGEIIESHPMKGTIDRGLTYSDDIKKSQELFQSAKDRAENLMIVDMVRNDLGRIADISSVKVEKLFNIEKYPTLWQMTSKVKAKNKASLSQIFQAMFPAASITGAPKISAMKIINELESSPRNIYTGTIGFISPEKQAQFNVAIRTLLINKNDNTLEYGVGGGIVWDSILEKEIEECNTKARILLSENPEFNLLETILWKPTDGYFILDLHLNRLEASASYFDYVFDRSFIVEELRKLTAEFDSSPHKVRLLLSRDGKLKLESSTFDNSENNKIYNIGLAKSFVKSDNVFLYHKTTNRLVYENALKNNPGFNDVILYNERNEITESTIANIIFESNGKFYTPPVNCGLLAGTYREWLIAKGKIEEIIIYKDQVDEFGNIYLINSVRGMYKVKIFED